MEEKAQASIEYLLIIAAVIGVAVVIGLYLKNIAQTIGQRGEAEVP